MAFKINPTRKSKPETPETLFFDLKISPDTNVTYLWSHQAELLRNYFDAHSKAKDISIEIPTGAGKTLIGLLIAEWRRIYYEERVLYLCPTRQLANQIYIQAIKLGINAHLLVGKQSEYPQDEYNNFRNARAIVISTYSSLFNINPRLSDAHVIIIDDAHAMENYISSMWSLSISKNDCSDLFSKIVDIFSEAIPTHVYYDLTDQMRGYRSKSKFIRMIPGPYFIKNRNKLIDLLDEALLTETTDEKKDLYYSWKMIRDKLFACNLYISDNIILIRPWIIPTLTHKPFFNATQRIFMSATLGKGGELERSLGIGDIIKLPIPESLNKHSTGRRFFIFPDYSLKLNDYFSWLLDRINIGGRSLIISPDWRTTEKLISNVTANCDGVKVFESKDIETSLDSFKKTQRAALILSNRYEGIDLPDEACRQLILYKFTEATNIQELFLVEELNIRSILRDRFVTRFTQAAGRCTRGLKDYSLVIVIGQKLLDSCQNKDNREFMHPELQAEIEFGIEQSNVKDAREFDALIDLFFRQGDEWKKAIEAIDENKAIISKELLDKKSNRLYADLSKIAKHEVDYQYALWRGDFSDAQRHAHTISDNLSVEGLESYRALWYYFTGYATLESYQTSKNTELLDTAKNFFINSKSCSKTISWFATLPELVGKEDKTSTSDLTTTIAVENIHKQLIDYGAVGKNFERVMSQNDKLIMDDKFELFEVGLKELGSLLGFNSIHPESKAGPDSIWDIADDTILIFEAKSEANKEGGISQKVCTQSKGHYDWAKSNIPYYEKYKTKKVIIVTHQNKIHMSAEPYIEDLFYMDIVRIREIYVKITSIMRKLRGEKANFNNDNIRDEIYAELIRNKIDPQSIITEIENNKLSKMEMTNS